MIAIKPRSDYATPASVLRTYRAKARPVWAVLKRAFEIVVSCY